MEASGEEHSKLLEEALARLERGEISLSRLDRELGNSNLAALVRRLYLERKLGVSLSAVASTILDFEEIVGRNIENPIGAVQVPLAVAGPLRVEGEYARGDFYVPLATTEGALVASINRGMKAVTLSGGARVRVVKDGMARAPLIRTPSVEDAVRLVEWVRENEERLREAASRKTRHGRLVEIQPFIVGNLVWLRLVYKTGDAMGMNMATIASDEVCREIEASYDGSMECVALSGNLCVDKKASHLNKLLGRGKYVVAEALLKRDVIEGVLKASAEAIHYVNLSKNLLGGAVAGNLGFNAHFANIIAAIFIATGQDVAQVVESSMGYTWTEPRGGDLYVSVTLPSLEVGTVGGGTWLPTQREALSIMGVAGGGDPPGVNALKFAEIVAASVLAGEVNLLAALAAGHLARAHETLARGRGR
ncbi:MAG: hydroxymethylglutaryl-CoA reductase (NADPH) [Desulfurococcales archaeon]|nr:hydroxymethylglutaryl-CoA reductase (NADPH) [Desulfurococcales archaeon]